MASMNAHHRRLTVWSAGCSTGEEAYTLAILLSGVTAARRLVLCASSNRPLPSEHRDGQSWHLSR